MSFLCHCKPTPLDEELGWLPLWNLEGTNISCHSTSLCCEVLKAWAKHWLNCPFYNAGYKDYPGSVQLFHQCQRWEGGAWLPGDGCSSFSMSEEGFGSVQLGQGTESSCLAASAQCPRWPLYLFLWCVGTLPVLCICDWETVSLLSYPVMPLSWDRCCQEKMALILKQRWHCAI